MNINGFSIISELNNIRSEKEKLMLKEKELSQASLTSLELIPVMYEWYKEIQKKRSYPVNEGTTKFKKEFIFLILFLFSPTALTGDRIASGVRRVLSDLFELKSPSAISNLCKDVTFQYCNYYDFRRDIHRIYSIILERLLKEDLI